MQSERDVKRNRQYNEGPNIAKRLWEMLRIDILKVNSIFYQ
jgi:hypothetical protein